MRSFSFRSNFGVKFCLARNKNIVARRVSQKCVECAQLSAVAAQQLHGKKGDGCWHDKRCPSKRSYYRNRQQRNEQRRLQYQQQVAGEALGEEQVETVSLTVAEGSRPYANLYIWREKRKDAPIHAIAASVFPEWFQSAGSRPDSLCGLPQAAD